MSGQIPPGADAIWVISDVMPDGSYGAVIQFGPDLAYPVLGGADLGTYVTAVLKASAAAEYDSAVMKQLGPKLSAENAVEVVKMLRERRGQAEWTAGPMTLTPGTSAFTGKPFLHCAAGGRRWQWDPDDALSHLNDVQTVVAGVSDDNRYYRLLIDELKLEDRTAREIVSDLGSFREEDRR